MHRRQVKETQSQSRSDSVLIQQWIFERFFIVFFSIFIFWYDPASAAEAVMELLSVFIYELI
jgi:hypothetical protein